MALVWSALDRDVAAENEGSRQGIHKWKEHRSLGLPELERQEGENSVWLNKGPSFIPCARAHATDGAEGEESR